MLRLFKRHCNKNMTDSYKSKNNTKNKKKVKITQKLKITKYQSVEENSFVVCKAELCVLKQHK